jgi:hypothetical protein
MGHGVFRKAMKSCVNKRLRVDVLHQQEHQFQDID